MTRILDKVALWIQRHDEPVPSGPPPIVRVCTFDQKPIKGLGYIRKGEWFCSMTCASWQIAREARNGRKP